MTTSLEKVNTTADEIAEVFQHVSEHIGEIGEDDAPISTKDNILMEISKYDPEVVKVALGKLGEKLLAFSKKVDYSHPLIADLEDGALVKGGRLYNHAVEAFGIASAGGEKWQRCVNLIRRQLNKNYSMVAKKIEKIPPRAISDESLREKERKVKKSKKIPLEAALGEGEDDFFKHPASFMRYVRYSKHWKAEIDKRKRIYGKLNNIGLRRQKNIVLSEIDTITKQSSNTYHGFVRLQLRDAALILARVLNCKFESGENRILVPRSIFKGEHFWETDANTEDFLLDTTPTLSQPRHNIPEGDLPYFSYAPRAYPLPKFKAKRTKEVSKIIDTLEKHPAVGNKPIFDHIWIIVPAVQLYPKNDCWFVKMNGEVHKFYEEWKCYSELDAYLTEKGYVCPIIMGENVVVEQKCYFIGYWV